MEWRLDRVVPAKLLHSLSEGTSSPRIQPEHPLRSVQYQWHPVAREYRTEKEADNWKWTRHFLASTSGRGEWIMEGEIPEIVVMVMIHDWSYPALADG